MATEHYIIIYLGASLCISAFMASDETDEMGRRVGFALLLAVLSPILGVASLCVYAWNWLESHAQARTFWNFLFNRKKLKRTQEQLEWMHSITIEYRNTGSLHHRLWRLAERCYFITNKFMPTSRPPNPSHPHE